MVNTAIIYNHRGRIGVDGTAPVEVRVTIDRKPYYINTGVRVKPKEWKFGTIVNRGDAAALNKRVSIMLNNVEEIINEKMGQPIDVREIRRRLWVPDMRCKDEKDDVLAWMRTEIGRLDVAPGTRKHYDVSLSRLSSFGEIKKWRDLTVENIHKFDAYLHSLKKPQTDAEKAQGKRQEPLAQGTVRNHHKDIRALLGRALKFGIIQSNPYDRIRGEIKRGDNESVEFLTDEERKRIERLDLPTGSMIDTVRDMFLFQSYTGMAYSDAQSFDIRKCTEEEGKVIYRAQRVKTGVWFWVQLLTPAQDIARKYGGRMPSVANQVFNKNLKRIADKANIDKRLTTHVARHTFATYALHLGIPIERVAKMVGHTNIKQTQRYAKVQAKDVFDEFDKMEKAIITKTKDDE